MSLQVILMGGPKSGTLHEVTERRQWQLGDELAFPVWPPLPMNSQEAEDQWPDVPKYEHIYRIDAVPGQAVPGTAIYAGKRP